MLKTLFRVFRQAMGLNPRHEYEQLWRLRHLKDLPPSDSGKVKIEGRTLQYVDPVSLYYQYKEIFCEGVYDVVLNKPAPVILDCGGNVGLSVLRFLHLYPQADITVYEADPAICEMLVKNLSCTSKVKVHCAAVWSEETTINFLNSNDDTGAIHAAGSNGMKVTALDINEIITQPLDLLKLDVEGAEYKIVRRLVQSEKIVLVDKIVAEVHMGSAIDGDVDSFIRDLKAAGFRYQLNSGNSNRHVDSTESKSGFRRAPFLGSTMMVYAWRPHHTNKSPSFSITEGT